MAVDSTTHVQRFKNAGNPCPICGGWEHTKRGHGERCCGFVCSDPEYVVCTREEKAGNLEPIGTQPEGYKHKLHGPCKCGIEHNPSFHVKDNKKREYSSQPKTIAVYNYQDEQNNIAYQVVRREDKSFTQRRPDGKGGYIGNLQGVTRLPYRLPELLKSPLDATIYVTEGEKDANNMARLGFIATTNSGGAGNWDNNLNHFFQGRKVVILPDNDDKGRIHAEKVYNVLRNVAVQVRIVSLPGLPEKGDVSDWIEAGGTPEKLDALANPPGPTSLEEAVLHGDRLAVFNHATEFLDLDAVARAKFKLQLKTVFGPTFPMREFEELLRAEKEQRDHIKRSQVKPKSARELMKKEFAKQTWIIPNILPAGLIALGGKQKIGKSWLAGNLSIAVSSGGYALGRKVNQGDTLYLALEDPERRLQDRLQQLLGPHQQMPEDLDYATEWPRMDKDGVAALEAWILSKKNPKLIIIDPWVKVKPRIKARAGETGYDADYEALAGVKRLADTYDICIFVFFHLRKTPADDPFDELNGTSGITACADGFLCLKRARGESDATLWGTGREYANDVDLALAFSNGYWNILGSATDYAVSKASKEVLDLLSRENKPLYPKEIAGALGLADGVVRKRLHDMKDRGEIKDTGKGYIPLSIANSGNGGNSSNASNGGNTGNGASGSVTSFEDRYFEEKNDVTHLKQDVERDEDGSVTSVTSVTTPYKRYRDDNSLFSPSTNGQHAGNGVYKPQVGDIVSAWIPSERRFAHSVQVMHKDLMNTYVVENGNTYKIPVQFYNQMHLIESAGGAQY